MAFPLPAWSRLELLVRDRLSPIFERMPDEPLSVSPQSNRPCKSVPAGAPDDARLIGGSATLGREPVVRPGIPAFARIVDIAARVLDGRVVPDDVDAAVQCYPDPYTVPRVARHESWNRSLHGLGPFSRCGQNGLSPASVTPRPGHRRQVHGAPRARPTTGGSGYGGRTERGKTTRPPCRDPTRHNVRVARNLLLLRTPQGVSGGIAAVLVRAAPVDSASRLGAGTLSALPFWLILRTGTEARYRGKPRMERRGIPGGGPTWSAPLWQRCSPQKEAALVRRRPPATADRSRSR